MKIGDCVIIRQNPHDSSLTGVVGRIRQTLPGAGLAGCDLLYIAYADPVTRRKFRQPFSASCLEMATPELLHRLAEQFERRAASLRLAAQSLR